jgi:hypothetical protein
MRQLASVLTLFLAVFFISVTPKSGKGEISGFGPVRGVISIHHTPEKDDRRIQWAVLCGGLLEGDSEHELEGALEPPIYTIPYTFQGCEVPYKVFATIVSASGKQRTVEKTVVVLPRGE